MSYTTKVISIGSLSVIDGSGYAATLQQSYVQPESSISRVQRDADSPVVTAVAPGLHLYLLGVIVIESGLSADDLDAKRRALLRALDSTRGPITITIENETGTARQRYMRCVVRKVDQVENQSGRGFMAALEAADDVRWRSTTTQEETWTLTESGTNAIVNLGDLEAYPTITITPQTGKSFPVWAYRRAVYVRWLSPYGGDHPIDITGGGLNTAALMSAGKVTNSTNMAVYLNGRYVPFWYGGADGTAGGFNHGTTRMWINFWPPPAPNSAATQPLTAEYIAEDATEWRVSRDAGLPPSGYLFMDPEIVYYAWRSPGRLHGVARGRFDTTPVSYSANDLIEYLPAAGYILYGPDGVVAEGVKDSGYRNAVEPLITQGSSNGAWTYDIFHDHYRSVKWTFNSYHQSLMFTEESAGNGWFDSTISEPWNAMGLKFGFASTSHYDARFAIPISHVSIDGRHMAIGSPTQYPGSPILSAADDGNANRYTLWNANAGVSQTVNAAFSPAFTLPTATQYTRLRWGVGQTSYVQADIQSMTVTFDAALRPIIVVGAEDTEYDLDMQILNETTGEQLNVSFPNMAQGEGLVINSENQTVFYEEDGSNQYAAVQMVPLRPRFMRLAPGTNNIEITETGMGEVDITFRYEPRWYT